MKRIFTIALIIFNIILVTGCGNKNKNYEKYITLRPENNEIQIEENKLSKTPIFINYEYNGTIIQLIAGIASDGTNRVSLNTCQSCNPSPYAYFSEENKKLVCQNCKNMFTLDDVGISANGCNPTPIPFLERDGLIIINTDILNEYTPMFETWGGPLK